MEEDQGRAAHRAAVQAGFADYPGYVEKYGGHAETKSKREAERAAPIHEARPPPPRDEIYINAAGRVTIPEGAIVITPGGKRYVVEGANLREDTRNRAQRRKAGKGGR